MKSEARSHVKKEKKKSLIYSIYTQYNILSVC